MALGTVRKHRLLRDKDSRSNPVTEAQLIPRAQHGEEMAFAALFELHKQRVYSLCLCLAGDAEKAEDLTQETFLQVFRQLYTFRVDSDCTKWLLQLALKVVLTHVRKIPVSPCGLK
jgi:RNA polymerase sigma-70 factor (ECF subfamily)